MGIVLDMLPGYCSARDACHSDSALPKPLKTV